MAKWDTYSQLTTLLGNLEFLVRDTGVTLPENQIQRLIGLTFLTQSLTPAQITADQNDYAPTGLSSSSALRLSTNASRNITGLAGGIKDRMLAVLNIGSNNIVLNNANTSSVAANRFAFDADLTLSAGQSCILWYDTTSSRWRCVANSINNGLYEPSLASQGDNRNAYIRLTGYTPTSHLNADPGFSYAAYTGFVTPIVDMTIASLMRLYYSGGTANNTRFFSYKAYSQTLQTVCYVGIENSRAGLRMDDGTNNNYMELFLEYQTDGTQKLRYRYALAGVVTGPTDLWSGIKVPIQAYKLQMINFGTNIYLFASEVDVIGAPVIATPVTNWTPTRVGFYGEHPSGGALDVQRAAIFDSYYAS